MECFLLVHFAMKDASITLTKNNFCGFTFRRVVICFIPRMSIPVQYIWQTYVSCVSQFLIINAFSLSVIHFIIEMKHQDRKAPFQSERDWIPILIINVVYSRPTSNKFSINAYKVNVSSLALKAVLFSMAQFSLQPCSYCLHFQSYLAERMCTGKMRALKHVG